MQVYEKNEKFADSKRGGAKYLKITCYVLLGVLLTIITFYILSIWYFKELEIQILEQQKNNSTSNELISIYLGDSDGNYIYSSADSFPTSGYIFNEEKSYCVNESTMSWNGSQITVNTQGSDSCYVYFDEFIVTLANYITDLSGSTQGTGELVDEYGYRYEGADPNNYISFNDEIWRIIGVFDTEVVNSDGTTTTESLVKIVRSSSLGNCYWDTSNINNWPTSSLYSSLNTDYYNPEKENDSETDYPLPPAEESECDLSSSGINDDYRDYIENVIWELGGIENSDLMYGYRAAYTVEVAYEAERGVNGYSTGNSTAVTYSTTTEGYIGLIYLSDYGYAALSSTCSRSLLLSSYSTTGCYDKNWLYLGVNYYTIVPYSSESTYVWYVSDSGSAFSYHSTYANVVVPVLYLKSDVEFVSGTGAIDDMYEIG